MINKNYTKGLPLAFNPNGSIVFSQQTRGGGAVEFNKRCPLVDSSPHKRNFVVESATVFLSVQAEARKAIPNPLSSTVATTLSRQYRALVLELCGTLKDAGDATGAELCTNLDFVWNFCEIVFFAAHPEYPVLPYMTDWIRVNFDTSGEILPPLLNALPTLNPSEEEAFWSLAVCQVARGSTYEAALIVEHLMGVATRSSGDRLKLELLAELLAKMPVWRVGEGVQEFLTYFQGWQDEARQRINGGAFVGHEQCTLIAMILCGDPQGLAKLASLRLITWYEFMVAKMVYTCPTAKPGELLQLALTVFSELEMNPEALEETRDRLLLLAMEGDILCVIKELQATMEDPWWAVHFLDLVVAAGIARETSGKTQNKREVDLASLGPLRNALVLDYGGILLSHSTLWELGVRYLEDRALEESARGLGKALISAHLERRPFRTEREATKLMQLAGSIGLPSRVISGIAKTMAIRKLKGPGMGSKQSALLWALKAGDGPLATIIVDSLLWDKDGGKLLMEEGPLLECLRGVLPAQTGAERMEFLGMFCDFKAAVVRKDRSEAVKLLVDMCQADLIPKRMSGRVFETIEELLKVENSDDQEEALIGEAAVNILMEYVRTKLIGHGDLIKRLHEALIALRAKELIARFRRLKGPRTDLFVNDSFAL